jgi:uncharacterized protein (TIGR03083 family)
MSEEHAVAYRSLRARVARVVASDPEAIDKEAPATPGWSVHDVLAHMVGVTDDVVAGRLDGVATNPWTAAQVESRKGTSVEAMLDEWEVTGPQFETLMAGVPAEIAGQALFDAVTHEHDIRHALGAPGARESDALDLAWRWIVLMRPVNGGPTLRFLTEQGEEMIGEGEPLATVGATRFELLRAQTGRRSAGEIEKFEWEPRCQPELMIVNTDVFSMRAEPLNE